MFLILEEKCLKGLGAKSVLGLFRGFVMQIFVEQRIRLLHVVVGLGFVGFLEDGVDKGRYLVF